MIQIRIFLTLFFYSILIAVFILIHCENSFAVQNDKTKIIVKCDWYHNIQFLGFYVAKQKGFYNDAGLDVTLEPLSSIDNLNWIPEWTAQEKFDFSLGSSTLSFAQAEGLPLTAVAATYQFGPQVFFAKKQPGLSGQWILKVVESWTKAMHGGGC